MLAVQYQEAIEYELMTKTRYMLSDVGAALPWPSFISFIKNLPPTSALHRAQDFETWAFESGYILPYQMANLIDTLEALRYSLAGITQDIIPSYRPHQEKPRSGKFGADPIPISDFDSWWNEN